MSTAHDTAAAAQRAQLQAFRRLLPSERVSIACQMSDESWRVTADGFRHRHPDMTDAEINRAVRQLLVRSR